MRMQISLAAGGYLKDYVAQEAFCPWTVVSMLTVDGLVACEDETTEEK